MSSRAEILPPEGPNRFHRSHSWPMHTLTRKHMQHTIFIGHVQAFRLGASYFATCRTPPLEIEPYLHGLLLALGLQGGNRKLGIVVLPVKHKGPHSCRESLSRRQGRRRRRKNDLYKARRLIGCCRTFKKRQIVCGDRDVQDREILICVQRE